MEPKEKEAMEMLTKINGGIDGLKGDITGVKDQVASLDQRIVVVESSMKSRIPSVPGVDGGKEKFSFQKFFNAIAIKDWTDAGYEKSVCDATKKVMTVGAPTAGGYLVPPEAMTELIPLLRAKSVCRELGATALDGLTGSPVTIPKQTGGATGYWVAENAAVTPSDLATGQLSLTPRTGGALCVMSNRLLRMSNPTIESVVRNDIAKTLANLQDLAALRGTGTDQPTGIANTANINTKVLGAAGAIPTIDDIEAMLLEIEVDNAEAETMGIAVNPRIWSVFRRIKDLDGKPLLVIDIASPFKGTIFGMAVRKTTQIPVNLSKGGSTNLSEIYLGNWADLVIATWGGMEVMASQETSDAFAKNNTWIRILQDIDVGLRHPESFCLCADAKIA